MAQIIIYISHPYKGKRANKKDVERIISKLIVEYPEHCFVSPIHTFGNWYKKVSYEVGMKWCIELLRVCDKMWVFGEYSKSKGCVMEINYCMDNEIDYWIKQG